MLTTVKAGVESVLPAPSVARTWKLCEPWLNGDVVCGELHGEKALPSTRHSNVEPASLESKLKVGVLSLVVPVGPPVIVVSGDAVSTLNPRRAGFGSRLPAASAARTSKVYKP